VYLFAVYLCSLVLFVFVGESPCRFGCWTGCRSEGDSSLFSLFSLSLLFSLFLVFFGFVCASAFSSYLTNKKCSLAFSNIKSENVTLLSYTTLFSPLPLSLSSLSLSPLSLSSLSLSLSLLSLFLFLNRINILRSTSQQQAYDLT